MNAIPNSFMQGASWIKKNKVQFQSDCAAMAAIVNNETVRSQLTAASKASDGQCNTGLSEAGWRSFAELIGECSPKSTKLIVPVDTTPQQHKENVMAYWLVHGLYTSSRVDGKGGSVALKDNAALYVLGLLPKEAKPVNARQVPDLVPTLFDDVSGDI